eukprot:scaffold246468_cov40-Tisochrysis_lutea.AAC.2
MCNADVEGPIECDASGPRDLRAATMRRVARGSSKTPTNASERMGISKQELVTMLEEEELKDAALVVFANKQLQPRWACAVVHTRLISLLPLGPAERASCRRHCGEAGPGFTETAAMANFQDLCHKGACNTDPIDPSAVGQLPCAGANNVVRPSRSSC